MTNIDLKKLEELNGLLEQICEEVLSSGKKNVVYETNISGSFKNDNHNLVYSSVANAYIDVTSGEVVEDDSTVLDENGWRR